MVDVVTQEQYQVDLGIAGRRFNGLETSFELLQKAFNAHLEDTDPIPPDPPAPTPGITVYASKTSDRANKSPLNGLTLEFNTRYAIFAEPNAAAEAILATVVFELDEAVHEESAAPYDLIGTAADGTANMLIFQTQGTRQLIVTAFRADHSIIQRRTVSFTIADAPPPPPLPVDDFGRRAWPMPVDARALGYYDGVQRWSGTGTPIGFDCEGDVVLRSQLPRWPGSTPTWANKKLVNAKIQNDQAQQVAIWFRENADRAQLVDVELLPGWDKVVEKPQNGAIDVYDSAGGSRDYINVTIHDAADHGMETAGVDGLIKGCRVSAKTNALASLLRGEVVEDSIFTMTGPLNEWHCGSHKGGGDRVGALIRRSEFFGGPVWADLGYVEHLEDVLIEGSPGWGLVVEISQNWHERPEYYTASYLSTVRCAWGGAGTIGQKAWRGAGGFGGFGNPAHLQHGHLTAHMGWMKIDHAELDVDVNNEVAWVEWDDSREDDYVASRGYHMVSDAWLTDSLINLHYDPNKPLIGGLARFAHPGENHWTNVVVIAPVALRDAKIALIGNTKVTIEEFLAQPTTIDCMVRWI